MKSEGPRISRSPLEVHLYLPRAKGTPKRGKIQGAKAATSISQPGGGGTSHFASRHALTPPHSSSLPPPLPSPLDMSLYEFLPIQYNEHSSSPAAFHLFTISPLQFQCKQMHNISMPFRHPFTSIPAVRTLIHRLLR